MDYFLIGVALATLVEFLVQISKDLIESIKTKDWWKVAIKVIAIVFGLAVAFIANAEFLPLMGQEPLTQFGLIALAGLVLSAGSTKVHDLFKKWND